MLDGRIHCSSILNQLVAFGCWDGQNARGATSAVWVRIPSVSTIRGPGESWDPGAICVYLPVKSDGAYMGND